MNQVAFKSKVKRLIARKCLDFFEALPKFNGGKIQHLQMIRQLQRKNAERSRELSKKPEELELDLLGIVLFEVFIPENVNDFFIQINKWFPHINNFNYRFNELKHVSNNISFLTSTRIGTITRAKHFRDREPIKLVPSLPTEVRFIELEFIKLFPSVYVLRLYIRFKDNIINELNTIQRKEWLPEIEFKNILPISKKWYDSIEYPSYSIRKREIEVWFQDLQYKIEKCIRPIIIGALSDYNKKQLIKLPAIDIFCIKNLPMEDANFKKAIEKATGWLDSFDIRLVYPTSFSDNKVTFSLPHFTNGTNSTRYRMLTTFPPKTGRFDLRVFSFNLQRNGGFVNEKPLYHRADYPDTETG